MPAPFEIQDLDIDPQNWTPIVAPFGCNNVAVRNTLAVDINTVISAFSIPASSQVTFPLYGSQMISGIKWSAGGTGMTGTVVAYQ